ncbi:MAG TPA: hypothetical protein VER78_05825 [Thermoanaerobaculia bacterium]|nr:hypothetical protein [Thermoanaerobaculia bacterium]
MNLSASQGLGDAIDRLRRPSLAVGLIALAACGAGWYMAPDAFFRAYLFGYIFFAGLTLGCLAIVMLQHLTGGAWGIPIRRILESGTRTLPLVALLFLPIAFGVRRLYPWARPEDVAKDALLQAKEAYLNVPFFLARAAFYFAVWILFAWFLNRWSLEQDQGGRPALTRRLQMLSAAGLVAYGLTMTFASIDWVMSLEPRWFSTMYGVMTIAGQALNALAFVTAALVLMSGQKPFAGFVRTSHYHDLGKLLLASVMFWCYVAFAQYLIIWAGNLPEEIPWYLRRLSGGWGWIGAALVLFHFALPFLLLLPEGANRESRILAGVAGLVVLMRFVDVYWLVRPVFTQASAAAASTRFQVHWLDLAAPIGIGGVWLAVFLWQLEEHPLLPARDPEFLEALAHAAD